MLQRLTSPNFIQTSTTLPAEAFLCIYQRFGECNNNTLHAGNFPELPLQRMQEHSGACNYTMRMRQRYDGWRDAGAHAKPR